MAFWPGRWIVHKGRKHFAIYSLVYGVRIADIRFVGRPDGSTSEDDANLIAKAPELFDLAQRISGWDCTCHDYPEGDGCGLCEVCEAKRLIQDVTGKKGPTP